MLETIAKKAENWAMHWVDIALRPSETLTRHDGQIISGVEFFLGNYLGAYVVIVATSIVYFVFFQRNRLVAGLGGGGKEILGLISGGFLAFVLASFGMLFAFAAFSYVIYHALGSSTPIQYHLKAILSLTFLEPIAALPLAGFALIDPGRMGKVATGAFYASAVMFALTRVLQILYGRSVMRALHPLTGRRSVVGFVGYCFGVLLFNVAGLGLVWLVIFLIIVPIE